MFSLERESEAAEVVFGEQYHQAVKKLQSLDTKPPPAKPVAQPSVKPKRNSGKPSLSTIASVAAAGIASVSATSAVDQVLLFVFCRLFSMKQPVSGGFEIF